MRRTIVALTSALILALTPSAAASAPPCDGYGPCPTASATTAVPTSGPSEPSAPNPADDTEIPDAPTLPTTSGPGWVALVLLGVPLLAAGAIMMAAAAARSSRLTGPRRRPRRVP